ncbi:MAG: HAMP domain-containing protein [Dactylosporangium sp.]|nr:HAMP domain-containing histidine kinase [Dactylosporangium sp.]NNJ62020.1 HAMP domain-containing protein [Dactylosporangium sp.]
MSSNPLADPAKRARAPRRWANPRSLRVRILAVFVGVFALMFLLVGAVTVVMLHDFQVQQLDDQLSSANQRFREKPPEGRLPDPMARPGPPTSEEDPTDLGRLFSAVQAPNTLAAQIIDGGVTDAAILEGTGPRRLPTSLETVLVQLPADGRMYTRDLDDLGTYRLVANRLRSGEILVTGLPMAGVEAARYRLIGVTTTVGIAALLIAILAVAGMIRVALAPLTRVAATARRVSTLPLHEGEVGPLARVPKADTDPRSEAGQVGAAFNRMLGHIGSALAARQASETRLRQFVADASHELRTPLAAIRGYAELAHRHRRSTPPPVGDALDRVEAAACRMTTLVEDLLLLARLDAKRPLASEPVDLSAMVIEAVTDAHVAGPGHRWLLDLPEESVGTAGDPARLHQVLANLLANARTHTPSGTTVTVSLAAGADGVALRVMDDGPGIPPHLIPRLFERFARGDFSRSRTTGSTGLGLAIVDAVVRAHGGSVDVTSVPGKTVFVVWLPLATGAQPAPSQHPHPHQVRGTLSST